LQNLRATPETANIPVILHSTKILDETEREFFKEHRVAVFPKQALTLPDSALRVRELIETLTAHSAAESSHE